MSARAFLPILRFLAPLMAAAVVVSCDDPRRQALRELRAAGIEPTGISLLAAVTRGDANATRLLLAAGVQSAQRDEAGRTPLRIAVDRHDAASATLLVDAKADPNAATPDGVSPLGAALANGDFRIAEMLIRGGAAADGSMPGGEKALPWAIRAGRSALVGQMMGCGADPHMRDQAGQPLLHIAMTNGRRELTTRLVELGADPGACNPAGDGAVHLALRQGWLDLIRPLVAAGADPNAPGSDGIPPLHRALSSRDLALGRLLLDCGADPRMEDASGMVPLARAAALRDTAWCSLLLEKGGGASVQNLFYQALRSSWREGAELFIRKGADPNRPGPRGTPLQTACAARDAETAAMLLHMGSKPAVRGGDGRLPVEIAAAARQAGLVKLLMDYGSPAGRALYQACARGDRRMAELLLACGAPATPAPPFFDLPLAAAIRSGDDTLAARLATIEGTARRQPPEGQTLLHLAIVRGCHRTVSALLAAGADPNEPIRTPVSNAFLDQVKPGGAIKGFLRRDHNITPLMLAADAGAPESVERLLAAGAKRDVWTRVNRFWPISFAAARADVPVMRAILGKNPRVEERKIVVSLSSQRVTVYDGTGNEVLTSKVSTGKKGYATPTGEFAITDKNRVWTSTLYHASMPYFQRLSCADFGLHAGALPGYPASHGCIRMPAGKAAELFRITEVGDRVQIVP